MRIIAKSRTRYSDYDEIEISNTEVEDDSSKIGISAPKSISILRRKYLKRCRHRIRLPLFHQFLLRVLKRFGCGSAKLIAQMRAKKAISEKQEEIQETVKDG